MHDPEARYPDVPQAAPTATSTLNLQISRDKLRELLHRPQPRQPPLLNPPAPPTTSPIWHHIIIIGRPPHMT